MDAPIPLISLREPSLMAECSITVGVTARATAGTEQRGAIFTRREVVDFILDLAGYTTKRALLKLHLLEPSFGDGDFLIPAIDRLLAAWSAAGQPDPLRALGDAIRAVELHRVTFESSRQKVIARLQAKGISPADAEALAVQWLIYGDFLLIALEGRFDVVIGNPPYVRQELIADALIARISLTLPDDFDRADIYIPFIERSLEQPGAQGAARIHLRRSMDEEPLRRTACARWSPMAFT